MLQAMDCDLLGAQMSFYAPTDRQTREQEPLSDEFQHQSENDLLLPDEPSSALASRIIRAQDNPSPPPVSPSNRVISPNDCRLIDVSQPTTPDNPAFIPANLPHDVVFSLLSPIWGPPSVKPSPLMKEITPHHDLITFDVGDEPTITSNSFLNQPGSSKHYFDDSKPIENEVLKETVGNTSLDEKSTDESINPRRDHQTSPLTYPLDLQANEGLDMLLTPVRRSSRARRSVTPRQSYPGATVEGSAHYIEPSKTIYLVPNSQSRTRRKNDNVATLEGATSNCISGEPIQASRSDSTDTAGTLSNRLRSLSPSSSHVLDQLVNESPNKNNSHLQMPLMFTEIEPLPNPSATLFSNILKKPSPKKPADIGLPRRLQLDDSSSKPSARPDLPRTPARRILVEEVPVSHTRLTSTLSRGANSGLPRTPILNIPPTDSPARRMLIPEGVAHGLHLPERHFMTSNNSVRPMRNRSQSAEPTLPKTLPFRTIERSTSVEPLPVTRQGSKSASIFFRPPTGTKQQETTFGKLPFPLVAETIPEEEERPKSTMSKSPVPNSTSSLKYRASKIPRIGSKPYARPTETARVAASTRTADFSKPDRPSQAGGRDTSDRIGITALHTLNSKAVGILKRKRSPDFVASPSKASRVPPDQVHRTLAPQVVEVGSKSDAALQSDRIPNIMNENTAPSSQKTTSRPTDHSKEVTKNQGTIVEVKNVLNPLSAKPSAEELNVMSSTDRMSTHRSKQLIAPELSKAGRVETSSSSDLRRMTRNRKKMQVTTTDVGRSSRSRKKAVNAPAPTAADAFNGMTAVALKALTNANTLRNQQYIAAKLATEVIRKSGHRPTSPVKNQTILQRTQDEKSRERRERAERRAQRAQRGLPNGRHSDSEDELELPTLTELDLDIHMNDPNRINHDSNRRGAGEDEDYKTPERQLKKLRLTDDLDLDEIKEKRRVKWNRDLFTAVYLHEVQLGARLLPKDPALGKGCLALTSKEVQLDTMGNLPNANMPVADLVQEDIVVKKFVYDDDEEVQPPVAKATRSRSKS